MNVLEVWLFVTPVLVMLLGLVVVKHQSRYRGRHVRDAGIGIFQPVSLPYGFDAAGQLMFRTPDGRITYRS